MVKPPMRLHILIACLFVSFQVTAQHALVSENILENVKRGKSLPHTIMQAHQQGKMIRAQLDSLQQMITASFPALADKMKRRSARLNAMTGQSTEGEILSLVPFDQKFSDYFRGEWQKMDALEKEINLVVKPFYGKELYKTQGYIPAWDSVYKLRRPALIRYRDGVIKLVQAEIAYLKSKQKMLESDDEAERMQYVEAELSVLQKLVLLKERLHKIIVEDGIEKVEYGLK